MEILSIELKNYKRFPLLGPKVVRIDFKKKLNILVGTNGSGKSSLLRELSPMPADRNDYYPGGYKKIEIAHEGKTYVLTSEFVTKQQKHYFVVDDEDLNAANLLTAQKELVRQHFRLTSDILAILTGQKVFTGLSLVERKKVFELLSDSAIDYILELFAQLKDQIKQKNQLLTSYTRQHQLESEKLLDAQDRDVVLGKIDLIKNQIDHLLEFRGVFHDEMPAEWDGETNPDTELNYLISQINDFVDDNYLLLTAYPRDWTVQKKTQTELQLKTVNETLQRFYENHESLNQRLKELVLKKTSDKEKTKDRVKEIEQRQQSLKDSLVYIDLNELKNLSDVRHYSVVEQSEWTEHFESVPVNDKKQFSKQRLEEIDTQLQNLTHKYGLCANEIKQYTQLKQRQVAYLEQDDVDCPSCGYSFKPNYEEILLKKAEDKIETLEQQRDKIEKAVEVLGDEKDTIQRYIEHYRSFFGKTKYAPTGMSYLWTHIKEKEIYFSEPGLIPSLLNRVNEETYYVEEYYQLNQEKQDLLSLIKTIDETEDSLESDIEDRLNVLNEQINEELDQREELKHNLRDLTESIRLHQVFSKIVLKGYTITEKIYQQDTRQIKAEVRNLIDEELRHLKTENVSLTSTIENERRIEVIVKDLDKKIKEIRDDLFVLNTAVTELSPKNGLIAKSVGSFINFLLTSMNAIIKDIWSYPFEIVLYNLDDDEKLDYRFKLHVNDQLNVPDISDSSSGMSEIVNLAFRIIVMRILKLHPYPNYLDEFGNNLDLQHRSKIYSLITDLVHDHRFSQIFLVSHSDTGFANAKDTDFIVMDNMNIQMKHLDNILIAQ